MARPNCSTLSTGASSLSEGNHLQAGGVQAHHQEVKGAELFNVGTPDFDGHPVATLQSCAMHLRDGCRSDGDLRELGKQLL